MSAAAPAEKLAKMDEDMRKLGATVNAAGEYEMVNVSPEAKKILDECKAAAAPAVAQTPGGGSKYDFAKFDDVMRMLGVKVNADGEYDVPGGISSEAKKLLDDWKAAKAGQAAVVARETAVLARETAIAKREARLTEPAKEAATTPAKDPVATAPVKEPAVPAKEVAKTESSGGAVGPSASAAGPSAGTAGPSAAAGQLFGKVTPAESLTEKYGNKTPVTPTTPTKQTELEVVYATWLKTEDGKRCRCISMAGFSALPIDDQREYLVNVMVRRRCPEPPSYVYVPVIVHMVEERRSFVPYPRIKFRNVKLYDDDDD